MVEELRARRTELAEAGQSTMAFLAKIVVVVFVVAVVLVEIGSPLMTRLSLDNSKDDVLDKATTALHDHAYDVDKTFPDLAAVYAQNGMQLQKLEVLPPDPAQPGTKGVVKVTVTEQARSFFVTKVYKPGEKWFRVEMTFQGPIRA